MIVTTTLPARDLPKDEIKLCGLLFTLLCDPQKATFSYMSARARHLQVSNEDNEGLRYLVIETGVSEKGKLGPKDKLTSSAKRARVWTITKLGQRSNQQVSANNTCRVPLAYSGQEAEGWQYQVHLDLLIPRELHRAVHFALVY